VLIFVTCVSLAVALAFGLLPALHASRSELRENLSESTGTTSSFSARRLLNGLVVDAPNDNIDVAPSALQTRRSRIEDRRAGWRCSCHPG
jgi:hypothetical protein